MSAPTRVAIYARCSDAKQADKELSIPAQVEACREHAVRHGWVVVGVFEDAGISGRTDDREAFQRMMGCSAEVPPAFDVVLVWKLSRFARNLEHSVGYANLLQRRGVRLESMHERIDDTPQGRLMQNVFASFDQFYSENLSQDTKRGMYRKAREGKWPGGSVPYGYTLTGPNKNRRMAPDPDEAPLIRRMFDEAGRGRGAATMARAWNREGLRTRRGKKWSTQTVLHMLRNRAYLGELRFGRDAQGEPAVVVPAAFPALVLPAVFQRVAERLKERGSPRTSPRRLGSPYLLSGLIRCGHCGAAFVGHPAKSGRVHYYGCQTKLKCGARECEAKLLNRDQLERAVTAHLSTHVLNAAHLRSLLADVNARLGSGVDELRGQRTIVANQLREQERQLERLVDALALGTIDPAVLSGRINALKASTDRLRSDRIDLDGRVDDAEPIALNEQQLEAYVRGLHAVLLESPIDERRAFLHAWVKRVTATGRDIEIEYTIPGHPGSEGGPSRSPTAETGGRSTRRSGEHATRSVNKIRRVLAMDKMSARTWIRTRDTRINSVQTGLSEMFVLLVALWGLVDLLVG